jgi:hypothetical protein
LGSGVGVAQQDEAGREQQPRHAEREHAHRDGEEEQQRVREVQGYAEEQDAPQDGRAHRVRTDDCGRERDREQDEGERHGRHDKRLQRPEPALVLHGTARTEQHRAPDAHETGADGGGEQPLRVAGRAEQVDGEGRVHQRHEGGEGDLDRRARHVRDVGAHADPDQPRRPQDARHAGTSCGS